MKKNFTHMIVEQTLCSVFCLFSESAYYQYLQINSNYQIKAMWLFCLIINYYKKPKQ